MGMYIKQQQKNTQLHERLTHQLESRLNQPRPKRPAAAVAARDDESIVSFRAVWFIVLTVGGLLAILLGFLQRQNPDSVTTSLGARSLAYLGIVSIVLGCAGLLVRRGHHHKGHHA